MPNLNELSNDEDYESYDENNYADILRAQTQAILMAMMTTYLTQPSVPPRGIA